jgi:type II secretory pathway pseudopilin PulG
MRVSSGDGFSLVELVVVLGLTLVVTAAIVDLVSQSRRRFEAEPEAADRQQRIRVAVDALHRDLLTANLVLPYRGASPSDPPGTFTNDVVTVIGERGWNEPAVVRTYYMRRDPVSGASQLMRGEGAGGDAPVIDGLTSLAFAYFGDSASPAGPAGACTDTPRSGRPIPIAGSEFTDGPWCPAAGGGDPFDADLLRIRKIAVRIAIRTMPGELGFDVAPRNRNHGR